MFIYIVSYNNTVLLFTVMCSSCILTALNAYCHLLPRISVLDNIVTEVAICVLLYWSGSFLYNSNNRSTCRLRDPKLRSLLLVHFLALVRCFSWGANRAAERFQKNRSGYQPWKPAASLTLWGPLYLDAHRLMWSIIPWGDWDDILPPRSGSGW